MEAKLLTITEDILSEVKIVLHNIISPHKACCIIGRDIANTTARLILAKSPDRAFDLVMAKCKTICGV